MKIFSHKFIAVKDNKFNIEKHAESVLLLVIKISRIFGVAPILLTSEGVRHPRLLIFYSRFLILLLNMLILTGFVFDVITEINRPGRSMRLESPVNSTVWVLNASIVMVLVTEGVINAPKRISYMFDMLRRKNKIKTEIRNNRIFFLTRNKMSILLILMLSFLCVLLILDFRDFYCGGLDNNKDMVPQYFYAAFYIEYFIVVLMEIQFVLLIKIPYNGLRDVKAKLKLLLDDHPARKHYATREENSLTKTLFEVHKSMYRRTDFPIDLLNVNEMRNVYGSEVHSSRICLKLYSLSGSYLEICTMIRYINDRNGAMLLFMLLLIFLDLVINPYYWIMSLLSIKYRNTGIELETMWCIFHAFNTMFVLEPCNKTLFEIEQIRNHVSLLINRFSTDRIVSTELTKFLLHLELNRPAYSPMGMCAISRPFITVIVSGVITYLVIIVQFQSTT